MGEADSPPTGNPSDQPLALTSRRATEADVGLLTGIGALWALQLIEDEARANPMSLAELTAGMRDFLGGAYSAVLFELTGEPVAYALFRAEGDGIYLRQFFVSRAHRGTGIGRQAVRQLFSDYFSPGCRVTVDMLIGNEPALRFWEAAGFQPPSITMERHADPAPSDRYGYHPARTDGGSRRSAGMVRTLRWPLRTIPGYGLTGAGLSPPSQGDRRRRCESRCSHP